MTDPNESIERLLAQADQLPNDSPSRVAIFEEAISIADSHRLEQHSFDIRRAILFPALHTGQSHKLIVHFAWCASRCRLDPTTFPIRQLLWEYRNIGIQLGVFHTVPADQIEAVIAEMRGLYVEEGISLRPCLQVRRLVSTFLADAEAGEAAHRQLESTPRDEWSDHLLTERSFSIAWLIFRQDYEAASVLLEPYLTGKIADPHSMTESTSSMLLPLMMCGRYEDAMRAHLKSAKRAMGNLRYLDFAADHIAFLALTGNLMESLKCLAKMLPAALGANNHVDQYRFGVRVLIALESASRQGIEEVRMRLSRELFLYQPDGAYRIDELRLRLLEWTRPLAARFDARNGNDWFTKELGRVGEYADLTRRLPLPGGKSSKHPE